MEGKYTNPYARREDSNNGAEAFSWSKFREQGSNGYSQPNGYNNSNGGQNGYSSNSTYSGGNDGSNGYGNHTFSGGSSSGSSRRYGGHQYSSQSGDLRSSRYNPYGRGERSSFRGGRGGGREASDSSEPYSREEEQVEKLFQAQQNSGINFDNYDNIPVEAQGNNCPNPISSFSDIELHPSLLKNIAMAKFTKPTPVQKYSLPIVLNGRDLMACAQTGSGKTAAFLFPLIQNLLKAGGAGYNNKFFSKENMYERNAATPKILILAPTRELATQIYDEARKFTHNTTIRPVVVYGGADARTQIRALSRGCDLLVATPGRLVDLMNRDNVTLAEIKYFVLDEADRMLDMGFEPQIRQIVEGEKMPPTGQRQTLMFSATFAKEIRELAAQYLSDYVFVTFGRVGQATELVTQSFEFVEHFSKTDALLKFVMGKKDKILVFVKMKKRADEIERYLLTNGCSAVAIHGDKHQREREYALRQFKSGYKNVLVATDVAARGLDINNVHMVINFDLPENIDDYIHRIGRTGRAGNVGQAVSFYNDDNENIVVDLVKTLETSNQDVPAWLRQASYKAKNKKFTSRSRGRGRGGFGRGRGGFMGGRGRSFNAFPG